MRWRLRSTSHRRCSRACDTDPFHLAGRPLQAAAHGRIVYFQQQQQIGLIDARTPALYKHWSDLRKGRQLTFELLTDRGETADVTSSVPLALRQEWQRLLLARSAAMGTGHDSDHDPQLAHEVRR